MAKPFPDRAGSMIVGSGNVFGDDDVRGAMAEAIAPVRTAGEVYAYLGCSPRCGRCARTIQRIMADAIGCADCRRDRTGWLFAQPQARFPTRLAYCTLGRHYDQYSALIS